MLKRKVDESKEVIIIGAGFIGCEVAEQIALSGKSATLVEAMPHILSRSFSEKISETAEEALKGVGVKLNLGVKVTEIIGKNGKVSAVKFEDGSEIPADIVIISIGYRPKVNLAKSAGLQLDNSGFIKVDSYMVKLVNGRREGNVEAVSDDVISIKRVSHQEICCSIISWVF